MADEPTLAELQAQAEDRGLPKYGTKAEIAERIREYDASRLDDAEQVDDDTYVDSAEPEPEEHDDEPDESDDDEGDESDGEVEPEELEPHRAGGYIDRHDGEGWTLDDEPGPVGPPEPVAAGSGGLPGNPVMSAAGWSLDKDE